MAKKNLDNNLDNIFSAWATINESLRKEERVSAETERQSQRDRQRPSQRETGTASESGVTIEEAYSTT